jgi:hypothetical protein
VAPEEVFTVRTYATSAPYEATASAQTRTSTTPNLQVNDLQSRRTRNSVKSQVLFVGNRRGYKNFGTLLQAYSSSPILREFELIAFSGHPLLPGEQEEIKRLGITDRVRFESNGPPPKSWRHAL